MARRRHWRSKWAGSSEDEDVGVAIHSSDDEANEDLSLEIAERARQRKAKRKRKRPDAAQPTVTYPCSASSDEVETAPDPGGAAASLFKGEGTKKKMRKLMKKRKGVEEAGAASNSPVSKVDRQDSGFFQDLIDAPEEEPSGRVDSDNREVKEASDNAVMRKLLRRPRYFDPGEGMLQTCYNCGEEGHVAADCVMEKRQKPCFVCGIFGHNARQCMQGRDCFICKRRGHFAKDCPDKHKQIADDCNLCLRCGDTGHDISSCKNNYAPDDLKKIQCYICKKYGHLCCADLKFFGPEEVSCYNCAQFGHSGVGCAKQRGEADIVASPTLCYNCGEEGHFARGCTKNAEPSRLKGDPSTPWRFLKKTSKSVPRDFDRTGKSKSKLHEERSMTAGKSRKKGGWIFDDPHPDPKIRSKVNGWASPRTPMKKSAKVQSVSSSEKISCSRSRKKQRSFVETPSQHVSKGAYQHGYSPSRCSNSQGKYWRT